MKRKPRMVIDINVFIAALLGSKTCAFIYEEIKNDFFQLVISPDLLMEIEGVVKRTKLGLEEREVKELINLIKRRSLEVIPEEKILASRDPKDNVVLECAVSGKSDFIVTGDKDLLILSPFRGIYIVTPAKFLKLLDLGNYLRPSNILL